MLSAELTELLKRLDKLEAEIQQLQKRIGHLEDVKAINIPISSDDLLRLPDALRKTMIVMTKLKEAHAENVAEQTDRTRGMESIYLNQLTRMGYLEKIKRGRRIYFRTLRII